MTALLTTVREYVNGTPHRGKNSSNGATCKP